nr:hypothetical protein [Tanacetum cinerariifolium]
MHSKEGLGGGGFVVLRGKSLRESKNVCEEEGGVEKMSSTGSKFMVRGEECLEGCVCAGRGEVNRSGDDFEVIKSLIGEIAEVAIKESGGRHLELMEEPFDSRLEAYCRYWYFLKEMIEGMLGILCQCIEQDLEELMHYLLFCVVGSFGSICRMELALFLMELKTADVAEKHFLVCAYMKQCGVAEVMSDFYMFSTRMENGVFSKVDETFIVQRTELYSAFVVEMAKAVCFFENHDVRQHLMNVHTPLVLLRSTQSPA